jgi:SAM-dependent methyltransferase
VLEHTFDPIRVLDNAATLLRPGGALVALTPSVWPLHNYPLDAWRILPNFYEEYAKRRGLDLLADYFEYGLARSRISGMRTGRTTIRHPVGPGFAIGVSRVVHKAFNTFGRSMFQPSHVAVAASSCQTRVVESLIRH